MQLQFEPGIDGYVGSGSCLKIRYDRFLDMYDKLPTRFLAATLFVLGVGTGMVTGASAQRGRPTFFAQQGRPHAPAPMPPMRRSGGNPGQQGRGPGNAPRGEHLAEWMNQHNNLSPAQQHQALEHEPGFRELPPQTQQRMHDRLSQLNSMNPQQRQKLLDRNEHMEQLSPDQRGQVRGAMQQLGSLPPDQRRTVARNFRELRDLPPDQRYGAMSRMPLNDQQRSTLNNLMRVEPMLPPPEPR
jgi:hypothetical protein